MTERTSVEGSKIDRRTALATAAMLPIAVAAGSTADARPTPSDQERGTMMGSSLQGRSALVTGAARGVGRAAAVALARQGCDVMLIDVADPQGVASTDYPLASRADLAEAARLVEAEGRRAIPVRADVRDLGALQRAVDRAVAEFGKLDIAVPNAGLSNGFTEIWKMPESKWRDVIDTNLSGVFNTLKAVLPHMVERRQGRVVVTGSSTGRHGAAQTPQYAASKWGVIGLVKSAALDAAPFNVTINAVAPTGIATPMALNDAVYRWSSPENPTRAGFEQVIRKYNALPIGTITAEDVAEWIVLLASDAAKVMTGTIIDVAAGANARYSA